MPKLVFVNRYFYPDHSATSQLLTDLVSKLNLPGVDIHIVTSRLRYDDESIVLQSNESWHSVQIHRCWSTRFGRGVLIGRAVDYLTFYLSSFFLLLKIVGKGDLLVAKTDPPLISVFSAIIVKVKKAKLVNWIQDLFPEVAKELGVSFFKGWLFRIVKNVRNWSLSLAECNVVLGEIMREKIEAEIGAGKPIRIIPNWVVGHEMVPVSRDENQLRNDWGLNGMFVVGYSGNLGRAHDYRTILKAIISLQDESDVAFVFIGGGAGYSILQEDVQSLGLKNVFFKPYQATEVLSDSLSVPDVHLISLEPSLEGLIVPSKFYGIISVGRLVMFLGDCNGEIARYIQSANCGFSVPMGDDKLLVDRINGMRNDSMLLNSLSKNSRALYEDRFSAKKSIDQWRDVLCTVLEK